MILNTSYGKLQRVEKLKNHHGFFNFLALDHQLSLGRISEIDSYKKWIDFSNSVDISGIVLNKGAFREISPTNKKSLILQTVGAPFKDHSISRISTATIEDAIKFDATCISIQMNFEERDYLKQIELCVSKIEDANKFNFPVLCMLNISNVSTFNLSLFTKYIKHCAELGVDFIKSPLPNDIDQNDTTLKTFISHSPPILFAGGDKNENFLADIKKSKDLGFQGICVGRNIFKSHNPHEITNQINQIFANE
jgi:DhnA family fructose-bisphosphate aldolase class Ia